MPKKNQRRKPSAGKSHVFDSSTIWETAWIIDLTLDVFLSERERVGKDHYKAPEWLKAYNTTSVSEHDMHPGTCSEYIQFLLAPSVLFLLLYLAYICVKGRTWFEVCVGAVEAGACGALNSKDSCFGLVLFLGENIHTYYLIWIFWIKRPNFTYTGVRCVPWLRCRLLLRCVRGGYGGNLLCVGQQWCVGGLCAGQQIC